MPSIRAAWCSTDVREVGGLLRSLDGGASWENVIDGLYVDEGCIDIYAVVVSPKISGLLTISTGTASSAATTAVLIGAT